MKPEQCKACGTCCRNGGPILHEEDVVLIRRGVLPLRHLVTLRAGELVRDDVAGTLEPLTEEVVKIAGTGQRDAPWRCCFHGADQRCDIYVDRPVQCRALLCTDPSALEQLYRKGRIQRAHLLDMAPTGWAGLTQTHEAQCSLMALLPAVRRASLDGEAAATVLEAVRFDWAFRELSVERAQVPPQALPFLLGRPLTSWLETFGLRVGRAGDGTLSLQRRGFSQYPS